MNRLLSAGLAGLLTVALALPAAAHTGHAGHAMFQEGLLHPLNGIDHLLAMVAVGIWAAQNGGKAVWLLPDMAMAARYGQRKTLPCIATAWASMRSCPFGRIRTICDQRSKVPTAM